MSKCRIILLCLLVSVTGCVAQSLPVELSATVNLTNGVCASTHLSTQEQVSNLLRDSVIPVLNSRPPCACGGPGEWTRIAHLNMSDTSQQCPANWSLITTPIRVCGQPANNDSCHSAIFQSNGTSYSRVCGKIIGYQYGSPDAFESSIIEGVGLEDAYLDGVSLTHGPPGSRQHIWSFAAVVGESGHDPQFICSCTNVSQNWPHQVPSFVGSNYFCESANRVPMTWFPAVHADDPLWDGADCGPDSACCTLNNPPWFCTTLPQPTTDDIELRICRNEGEDNENIIVGSVDIYIM